MEAHIAVINYFRRKFIKNTQIIAITGSIGKTSTKDMVFNVLKRQFATGKSIRNSNVQVKIGLNIQNMKKGTEIFVQEVGGGRPGGASRHARMISPEIAVITNIGTAHIGNYNSQRELALNKLAITDGLCDEGTVFLNGDDSMLTDPELLSTIKQEIIYYGIENPKCDYYAQDIQETESGLVFSIYSKPDDAKTQCHLNVFGTHNVKNAVCAFAIGRKYGMETAAIVEGIAAFKTSETRQNLICVGPNRIFVDCYNASIDSVKSSLDTLESIGGLQDKRIAVLGDITGMGDKQEFVNEEVASIISKSKIDEFICYGKEGSSVVNKIKNINRSIRCTAIDKRSLLEEKITDSANKDTIILFKGSSKMRLDEIIDSIYGTALADQRYIDEGKHVKHKSNGVHYNLFEKYAAVSNMRKTPETYKMKGAILGKPVKIVCDNACKGNKTLKELIIGQNVCHIGKNSFRGCVNLEKVIIPESVKMIDQYAFSGCPKLTDIRIANNHIYIDQSAFDESAEKGQE